VLREMISSERSENDLLLKQLNNKKALVRANALESLAKRNHPKIVSELIKALSDSSPLVRWSAALCLGELNKTEAVDPLIAKLSDHFTEVRRRAVEAIGNILQDTRKCPLEVIKMLKDPDELIRIEAAESIGAIGDQKALPSLWKVLHDRSPLVRSYVAAAIGELGNRADIKNLEREFQKERSDTVKVGYYHAIYSLGQHNVLPNLLSLLESKDYRVRCATANTLCDGDIVNQSNVFTILNALNAALKKEKKTALAPRRTIQSSIRVIKDQFPAVAKGKSNLLLTQGA
jgi:HEAT repeat protein